MDEIDRFVYFDGPPPESLRPFLAAFDETDVPDPSPADRARIMDSFFASVDERLARAEEDDDDGAEDSRRSDVYALPPPPPAVTPPTAQAAQVRALDFDGWAELSIRLIGIPPEEKLAVLDARKLTLEAWARLDGEYLRVLSDDLLAGRPERPALYSARCSAEMARRRGVAAPASVRPKLSLVKAPEHLKGTAEAFEIPAEVRAQMGRLPFERAPAAPPAPVPACGRTMKVRAMPSLGETRPLDDSAIQKVVAALPFSGGAGSMGVVYFPPLTLKQYVSLRADLAERPAEASETRQKYGVPNEAAQRALEEHWREKLDANAELRAEYDAAVETYGRWLRRE